MLNIDDDTDDVTTDSTAPGPDGPTRVTREVECALTDAEIQERGEEMAAAEREIDRLKDRRRALNAAIRAKLDRMTVLAKAIDARKEVREVPCTWRPDYQRSVWELTRDGDPSGKVIQSRAMTVGDKQTRLPIDSAADAAAAADDDDDAYDDDDCHDADDADEARDDSADDLLDAVNADAADDLFAVEHVDVGHQNIGVIASRKRAPRATTPATRKAKVRAAAATATAKSKGKKQARGR